LRKRYRANMDVISALLLLLILAALCASGPRRPVHFPPGPAPWPLLGNIRQLYWIARHGQTAAFDALAKQYGPVFGLVLPAGIRLVVIRDLALIKHAFGELAFSGRPDVFTFVYRAFGHKQGLAFGEGPQYMEHRRFTLRHLKEMGFGSSSMEDHIADEYRGLAEVIKPQSGQPIAINGLFDAAIINVIWQMIAGRRFALGDPALREVMGTISEMVSVSGVDVPVNLCPPLRHVAPRWSGFQLAVTHRDKVSAMFSELIRQHVATRKPQAARDFIDDYLEELETPGASARGYCAQNLAVIGMDLFSAGSDTTTHTLAWTLLLLARHPAVQQRLQAELDTAVGRQRLPALSDQPKLPYTQAVIQEVLRFSSLLPHALPHCTSFGAAQLGSYHIPAGTFVFSDLRSVHLDKAHWGDPYQFRPDRFLDADGAYHPGNRVVAFGIGKRHCPAELVARLELLLFTTGLMHQFHVRPVPGDDPFKQESEAKGFVKPPPNVQVIMDWRTD